MLTCIVPASSSRYWRGMVVANQETSVLYSVGGGAQEGGAHTAAEPAISGREDNKWALSRSANGQQ